MVLHYMGCNKGYMGARVSACLGGRCSARGGLSERLKDLQQARTCSWGGIKRPACRPAGELASTKAASADNFPPPQPMHAEPERSWRREHRSSPPAQNRRG